MRAAGLGLGILVGLTGAAQAHSPVPGIEGFYVGLLHPFSSPAQILLILSAGLLIGGFPRDRVRWLLAAFLGFSFAGLLWSGGDVSDILAYTVVIATSALAAASANRLFPAAGCVAIAGLLLGAMSVPDGGLWWDRFVTMSGSLAGLNILMLYLSGCVVVLNERVHWAMLPVAFRIAAAWIAAVSSMMLAIQFAPASSAPAL
ncbi:HupE/UreJ family protein [Roseibium sp.]|uniref:HupE/UreJ family protein n=1 Tax=Roseibium sp. TaxID=1936156 RepID=UPI003918A513